MYYLRDKQNSFWGMFNASNTARPIHWLGVIILIFLLMSSFFHLEKFFSLTFLWAMFSMVWPFSKPQGRPVAALSRREGAGPASITTLRSNNLPRPCRYLRGRPQLIHSQCSTSTLPGAMRNIKYEVHSLQSQTSDSHSDSEFQVEGQVLSEQSSCNFVLTIQLHDILYSKLSTRNFPNCQAQGQQ